jgi:streptogramin lyase
VWSAALLGCVAALAAAVPAGAVTITEFPVEPGAAPGAHGPQFIKVGPDQNLWFTDGFSKDIGRMSTLGERFAPFADSNGPVDLVVMPDGSVAWTTGKGVGRRYPSGLVQPGDQNLNGAAYAIGLTSSGEVRLGVEFSGGDARVCAPSGSGWTFFNCGLALGVNTRVTGLTLGADGRLWAAVFEKDLVQRLTTDAYSSPDGPAVELPVGSGPARLALGGDGNLWVTVYGGSRIERITPAGVRTPFALPAGRGPNDIAAGPDGALWFTEYDGNRIGRMTLDGVVTNEYEIPSAGSHPIGITGGPDAAMWFTESATGKIGRLQLDPSQLAGGGGGGGGGAADHFAPRFLRGAAFKPKRFRVAAGPTPTSALVRRVTPKGSSLRYSLSEPSTVTIVIAQPRSGRRVGRTCRAPTRSNRRRPRCTRYVRVGKLKRRGLQGANTVKFTGRIGRKALKPGSYRATATAKDAAGNVSRPSVASFTIAAR